MIFRRRRVRAVAAVRLRRVLRHGNIDSPLANGMNWGIFTLLGVIVTVLGAVAGFFVYIIRRERGAERQRPPLKNPV